MDKWLTLEIIVKWEPRISVRLKMIPALMNVIRFITVRTILDFISFLLVMYKFSSYPTFIIIYVLVKSQSLSTFNLFLSSHFCGSEQQILSCGLYDVPFGPDYTMVKGGRATLDFCGGWGGVLLCLLVSFRKGPDCTLQQN